MCGRYSIFNFAELLEMFKTDVSFRPVYNAAPTMSLPIVTNEHPGEVVAAKWGLVPSWATDHSKAYSMINARSESIDSKPSYKESFESRRCIVPANGFYEWKKNMNGKVPYYVRLKSDKMMFFAGIWAEKDGVKTFSIATVEANSAMAKLHDRMPAVLGADWKKWLEGSHKEMLMPCADDLLDLVQVSNKVNKVGNEGPELIKPVMTLGSF